MKRALVDKLWGKAMDKATEEEELLTRYHFAQAVLMVERQELADLISQYQIPDTELQRFCAALEERNKEVW